MASYKSDLLNLLSERGHIHQLTDAEGLDALATREIVTAYNGYDATAASLHVGNLASVMLLRRLQQAGHRPIALMGGVAGAPLLKITKTDPTGSKGIGSVVTPSLQA